MRCRWVLSLTETPRLRLVSPLRIRRGDSEHPWVRPGRLFTSGPGTYKIPSANDVPIDFRVSLLKGAANPRAVFSSKAVGEPPFLLAMSVFFAAKEAVEAARADAGITSWCAREGAGRGRGICVCLGAAFLVLLMPSSSLCVVMNSIACGVVPRHAACCASSVIL